VRRKCNQQRLIFSGACEDFQTDEGIMKSAPDIYEQLVDSVLDSSPDEPVALEYSSSTSTGMASAFLQNINP
jgi:hypothetical protein